MARAFAQWLYFDITSTAGTSNVSVLDRLTQVSEYKTFGGSQKQYKHWSQSCQCEMRLSVYLPPQAAEARVPAVYWLSGLTCTDENFVIKAGAQRYAAELGIILITPDTSPRGEGVATSAAGEWDFGQGAGFYVDATREPWRKHFQMYSYISNELPGLVEELLPVDPKRCGISGHSMGGHGALVIGLRNAARFRSVSAFSPIVSPLNCAWGQKAMRGYLGDDQSAWLAYDSCELLKSYRPASPLLVDVGDADHFLVEQLKPELLKAVCAQRNIALNLRLQPGYDHSYFFVSTFIGDHLRFHAQQLTR